MRTRFAALIPVAIIALAGCASTGECGDCATGSETAANASSVNFVNVNCPIGGEAIATDVAATSYDGHDVGFCCPGCKGKWEAKTAAFKDTFIAEALAGEG